MSFKSVAVMAAKAAAKIHLKYFGKEKHIQSKTVYNDKVTIADITSEKKIVSIIKEHYPDHNILAEEHTYDKTESEYTWVIDPLDGTNNYAHDMPIFCVSIALAKNNEVIVGVVYDPLRNELFCAEKGKGATLNGKRIYASKATKLNDALIITGFPYERGQPIIESLDMHRKFFDNGIVGIRRLGSAALDLCYIASGRGDGFWEYNLKPWDYAAAKLIIEEVEGKITDKAGNPLQLKPSYVVASNGKLHKEMIRVVNS